MNTEVLPYQLYSWGNWVRKMAVRVILYRRSLPQHTSFLTKHLTFPVSLETNPAGWKRGYLLRYGHKWRVYRPYVVHLFLKENLTRNISWLVQRSCSRRVQDSYLFRVTRNCPPFHIYRQMFRQKLCAIARQTQRVRTEVYLANFTNFSPYQQVDIHTAGKSISTLRPGYDPLFLELKWRQRKSNTGVNLVPKCTLSWALPPRPSPPQIFMLCLSVARVPGSKRVEYFTVSVVDLRWYYSKITPCTYAPRTWRYVRMCR
jgi:hypothetical protein